MSVEGRHRRRSLLRRRRLLAVHVAFSTDADVLSAHKHLFAHLVTVTVLVRRVAVHRDADFVARFKHREAWAAPLVNLIDARAVHRAQYSTFNKRPRVGLPCGAHV